MSIDLDRFQSVNSSNLESVGCKDDILVVKFKSENSFYCYPGLANLLDDLVSAPSVGKYFHDEIRHQKFFKLKDTDDWPEPEESGTAKMFLE